MSLRRLAIRGVTVALVAGLLTPSVGPAESSRRLVVHEWGTFTVLQTADGRALAGINTDDEPVPAFVHQIGGTHVVSPLGPELQLTQGTRTALPEVTLRLETPVIYFHPSDDRPLSVEVCASFHGGWLTQYYPGADARIDGMELPNVSEMDRLTLSEMSVGSLRWSITLGALRPHTPPPTGEHVWLAPRSVRAADAFTERETERFLFYRGVGHRDAAFRVTRGAGGGLAIEAVESGATGPRFPGGWLLSARADGTSAYRAVPAGGAARTAVVPSFAGSAYARESLPRLRAEMKDLIVREGLFDDEAEALLSTWELSYFRSPGLRLFFVVPRSWTDGTLPLEIRPQDGTSVEVVRVMVGRIELATPEQDALLARIAAAPTPNLKPALAALEVLRKAQPEKYKALASGLGDPADLEVPVPEPYRAFLALGRFRFPLLHDAARRSASGRLPAFLVELQFPGAFDRY